MKTLYISHAVANKKQGLELQAKIEELGFKVVNPFDAIPQGSTPAYMVEHELRLIESSDGVVAFITKDCRATHMEAFYAARILHRPTFVLYKTKIDSGRHTHPWYDYLTSVYTTEKALLDRLECWKDD